MVSHTHLISRHIRAFFTAVALAAAPLLLMAGADRALAQEQAIYTPGEPIITGFSGVVPPNPPPPSGDPIDQTFIDLDGNSMIIQQLQPNGPPSGQLIPSPTVFSAKARDVGQVFGIALDDAQVPNIYLSATSAFGLQIVVPGADGNPQRAKVGAPNAKFMAGQWGTAGGAEGTPGSIYKVDGTTGQISLFTTIAANSGAGLGDIVFDKATEQFFVSDLDTGLIYRLGLDGTILDTFDHGVAGRPNHSLAAVADDGSEMNITDPAFNAEDPASWGYTQPERKVYGLAMHGGRLYYAVAQGPQVWSVGINLDGSFANDARWELDVTGLPSKNEISNIVFDNEGRMVLAQRGPQVGSYDYTVFAEPKTSSVVRYTREIPDDPTTPSIWIETPETYAIGFRPDGENASGGIALGYAYDPQNQAFGGACGAFLWSTGDSLRDNPAMADQLSAGGPAIVHGLQGNDHNLVRPDNDPPTSSFFTDYDGHYDDQNNQGHIGDVEIWQKCEGYGYIPPYMPPPGYQPPPTFNLTLTKVATPRTCVAGDGSWFCGFTIRVKNTGSTIYWGPVSVDDWLPDNNPGASMSFGPQPPWSCGAIGATEYECDYPPVLLYPGDSLDLYETVKLPMRDNQYCYLDNAASIDWPYGVGDANPGDDYDYASARIPDQNCRPPQGPKTNLKLEKFAHPKDCLQSSGGWDCVFYIKVTNTGPGDYNAPIEVKDTLGFAVPAHEWPTPPWSCSQAGADITCDYPATLLHPGEAVWLGVSAVIPYGVAKERQICRLENKARIIKAPGGSDLNTDPSDDQAGAAATIPSDDCNPNRPRTDLSIRKDAVGCVSQGDNTRIAAVANGFVCAFRITVKNEGPGSFSAPITVHDTFTPPVPPALVLSAPPSGLCTPAGGGYDCTSPGAVNLVPGQTWQFFIGFKLPANAEVCDVKNAAMIASPAGGTPLNVNPANDNAAAAVHIPSRNCEPNRQQPQLTITKTPGPCFQSGDGLACAFAVKVTNGGNGPAPGPIVAKDFPDNNRPVTLSGAVNCQIGNDTCTYPGALPAGGSFGFRAIVTLSQREAAASNCSVQNSAAFVTPQLGTHSTATDTVPQPLCAPPRVVPLCTLRGTKPDGSCCPDGQLWNGRACAGPGEHKPPKVCPEGTTGDYPNCVPIRQTCKLPLVGTYPNCHPPIIRVCPEGTKGTYPNCYVPETPTCQPPLVGTYPNCHPPIIRLCPRDSHGTFPDCVCNRGTVGNPGSCTPITQQCPKDSHLLRGQCVCNQGTHGTPGNCLPNITTGPLTNVPLTVNPGIVKACPSDSVGEYPKCVCKRGTTGTPGKCVARPILQINPGILLNTQPPPSEVIK